jgi:hypothetical protein
MEAYTKVNSKPTILKATAISAGMTERSMKDFGSKTKCMEKEISYGLMEEDTRESIRTIKKKGMDSLHGQMDDPTKDNGKMGSRTEEGCTKIRKDKKKLEFGQTGRRSNGCNDL